MIFPVGSVARQVEIFVYMRGSAIVGKHLTEAQAKVLCATGRYHREGSVVYVTELSPV